MQSQDEALNFFRAVICNDLASLSIVYMHTTSARDAQLWESKNLEPNLLINFHPFMATVLLEPA